jgi:hypothetical protein
MKTKPDLLLARTELDEVSRKGKNDSKDGWADLLKPFDFM